MPDDKNSRNGARDQTATGGTKPGPAHLETLFDGLTGDDDTKTVSVGEILAALAHRSYGPLLLLPALISVLPVIGALPGMTWTTAAITLLISLNFLFSRRELWLPAGLRRMEISKQLFDRSVAWAKPWLRRLDHFVHPRFNLMMAPPWPFIVAILCVGLSLGMFALSMIPGGVVIPAFGVILLAVGLTTHDGLVLLLGILASAAAFWGVAELIL